MEVTLGPHSFELPGTPDELLLGAWIAFVREHGQQLDERAAALEARDNDPFLAVDLLQLMVDRSFSVMAFFASIDLQEAKDLFPVKETCRLYRDVFSSCFKVNQEVRVWKDIILPPAQLDQSSKMTFGEVLDSKAMLQNSQQLGWTRWELIRALCAIFLRPDNDPYKEEFAYLDGIRMQLADKIPMRAALMISAWYEELNQFLESAFTVFQGSAFKADPFMKKHFANWGWVNCLKQIAKAKVFDIPGSGMNSIQCARVSKAFDVLMYASEEKEFGEAMEADFQAKYPSIKR